jgi:probable F420-dependent oxidoreductase
MRATDRRSLLDQATRVERLGYSTFLFTDHFLHPLAPLLALQAVVDATTTLRVATMVLNQSLRHPAVLAKELATLDVLSGGRLEIGIGAGNMKDDYEPIGLLYDKPSARIEQLEETVVILKGLFGDEPFSFSGKHFTIRGLDGTPKPAQRPHPPIALGGSRPKVLSVAARHADIVTMAAYRLEEGRVVFGREEFSFAGLGRQVEQVRDAAGERFDSLELTVPLWAVDVTDDPQEAARRAVREVKAYMEGNGGDFLLTEEDVLAAPHFLIGSREAICDKLLEIRERSGVSYFTARLKSPEALVPIMEKLETA